MGFFSKLLGVGAAVAAPFTGGTSLAALPGILGAGSAVAGALEGRGSGKTASGGAAAPPVPYIQNAQFPVSVPAPPTFGRPAAEQAMQEEAQRIADASRRGQRTMLGPLPGTANRSLLMYPHSEDEFNYS